MFLVLAAQYESWSLPLAVILVVPMCLLCSVVGVALAGMDINIFAQIGFVVLVGLASKNAILIVEFAKEKSAQGASPREATVEACRLRLRPIIMTSLAFILGVVPLALAVGAGAEMRRTLGHRRLLRHARRHAVRHLPDAGVLLRRRAADWRRLHAGRRRRPRGRSRCTWRRTLASGRDLAQVLVRRTGR